MDDIECAAIAAEGCDPDDPAVVAALARGCAVLGFHAVPQHQRSSKRR
jgi:hypothetical protein